jgi:hypothetical protein
MRTLFKNGLVLAFLCYAQNALALYNGNPSAPMMPEQGIFFRQSLLSLKAGYAYDAVFSQPLKMHNHHPHGKIKKYSSHAQFGTVTLGCADRVELYSGLGSMSSSLSQHIKGDNVHYRTDTHFAWSLGGRTLFAYWDDLQFGISASYLAFSPPIQSISVNAMSEAKKDADLNYRQWQIGAGISYHIWWLYPYIGAQYSNARAKFSHLQSLQFLFPNEEFTLKNKKQYGIMIGCGIAPERGIALNVEARFIDETALTASADIKF